MLIGQSIGLCHPCLRLPAILDPITAGRLVHRFRGKVWGCHAYSYQHGHLNPCDSRSDVMIQDSELR